VLPEYKTILYATDLSPNSAQAFRHAVSLARRYGGRLHILHVLPESEAAVVQTVAAAMGQDRLADLEVAHHEEVLSEIRQRLEKFATDECSADPTCLEAVAAMNVVHGDPVEKILGEADRLDADLIVMGSHSRGRLRQVILGAVSEKILRRSRRPVFVSRLVAD